ncbi:MAG TPA: hypothetical protein VHH36_09425 [Candidatus Thermoplasmatota archaeon]|nr:hypothetical protein [Candidatus Thermoplasmatota archaeon]
MRAVLAWSGSHADAVALARLLASGAQVVLAPGPWPAPRFVLEEQAACLGVRLVDGPAARSAAGDPARAAREALARGIRAFVAAAAPPLGEGALGRFLDDGLADELDALGAWGAARTLAVSGGPFARRVDVVAGDVLRDGEGWRLALGLRGC